MVPRDLSTATETSVDADGVVTGPHRLETPHPDLVDALAGL
ncbi:hypothetical protein ACWDKQ_09925 [Saccharopolyspora sp. NPDC000995]